MLFTSKMGSQVGRAMSRGRPAGELRFLPIAGS
jgi:hypothetical protein